MGEFGKPAELEWRDGRVPIARAFDDPYFSLDDGVAETAHVFLAGNDLPARFRDGFHIAELGFGTGLNVLVAWRAWLDAGVGGVLKFTSFEGFPLAVEAMEQAHRAWPELADLSRVFLDGFDGATATLDGLELEVIVGDARDTVASWEGRADAWFLDGFSPAKNPEMWEPALMAEVGKHTKVGGTMATYTAAGHARRGLEAAGFAVERVPGFGRKRHMTRGALEGPPR